MIHIRLQPGRLAEFLIVLALATNLIGFAAWVTHVVSCFRAAEWTFLVAGAIAFPVAVVHGIGIWFGAW